MTNFYRTHTNEELISKGKELTSTPLERELAERLGDLVDEVEWMRSELDER